MNNEKPCTKCKKIQPLISFSVHKRNPDGRSQYCRQCNAAWARNYRANNVEKLKIIQKRYHEKCRPVRLQKMKDYILRMKDHVYTMYGNKCDCCGEKNREFFAIDHVEGGGTQERRRLGTRGILVRASRNGFQKDKYRLLCHNCNMSLGFFGYCPHHPEIKRPVLKKFVPRGTS